ncbi:branched-chain amino acid aminotransferase [Bosea sp. CRIB-10]|uniref:aminotransferase class IV n=1 Tax=Bosea sp. CRIB-10 TaxID=378404 RepID=UPI0008E7B564|nr:aminotransferase class IV [Bosea sp. CRIB-10]SFD59060.1 branched-chain amino acid aminotransferase [Bosea sp. CRIB-10]
MSTQDELASIPGLAYMDGKYLPLAEATIPIADRGFLRSDITYDAIHVWKGRIYRLREHIKRFRASMTGLRMDLALTDDEISEILVDLVRRTGYRDAFIMVMCSRGIQPPGTRDPRLCRNRLYAYVQPFLWIANEEQRRRGLKMVLAKTQRIPSEALDQRIKNFHWLDLTMSLFEAYDRGAEVTILPLADGTVTEGPGFNVFFVKDGVLVTPDRNIFEGITRRSVIEIAGDLQMRCEIRAVRGAELSAADEIFTATTAGGITPVTEFEGRPIGDGKPGPITARIRDEYWRRHDDETLSTAVSYE